MSGQKVVTRGGNASLGMLTVTGVILLGACSPAGSGARRSPERQTAAGTLKSTEVFRPSTLSVASPGKGGASTGPFSSALPVKPAPYGVVEPSPGAPPLGFGQPVASREAVLNNHARPRVDGEKAARDIAKLVLNSRTGRSRGEVFGPISSPTLDAQTCALLVRRLSP